MSLSLAKLSLMNLKLHWDAEWETAMEVVTPVAMAPVDGVVNAGVKSTAMAAEDHVKVAKVPAKEAALAPAVVVAQGHLVNPGEGLKWRISVTVLLAAEVFSERRLNGHYLSWG